MKKLRKKVDLSKENILKLKSELWNLVHVKRKRVIEELRRAVAQGDISDSAEYDSAKQEQVEIEERINQIQFLLNNLKIVEQEESDVVAIGKSVRLLDLKSGEERVFKVGTFFDIDVEKNVISNDCPLARSILGKKVGEQVLVQGRNGYSSYWIKIIEVSNT